MIDALLQDTSARRAAAAARPDLDVDLVLARVAWNVITEPGDGVCGTLIDALGPVEALRTALADAGAGLLPADRHPQALHEAVARWQLRASPHAVADAFTGAATAQARLLLPEDEDWPTALDDLGAHAPTMLWVRGDVELLRAPSRVAIVGARAASNYGELLAAEFAGDLAASGTVVVSGGAYGIDGAAHRAALRVGGPTVAMLAGGVDRAYPQGHQTLLQEIAVRGAVASEVPCGTAPTKWRFLSRNRTIAALGDATVVVEAGWRSGSINTAGHAASLGRPLGAVPGPVSSASSAGCHRLLREYDARCVTTTAEIRELWAVDVSEAAHRDRQDPDQTRLLDALSTRAALRAVELARRCGIEQHRVEALLGVLELEGIVVRVDGGWRRSRSTT